MDQELALKFEPAHPAEHAYSPSLEIADLVPPGSRCVVIAPSLTEELFRIGAILAELAGRDYAIALVEVVDQGDFGAARNRTGHDNATEPVRAAVNDLGFRKFHLAKFRFPTGALERLQPALIHRLKQYLRNTDVVLTTCRRDSDRDCALTACAVEAAARECGCPTYEAPEWTGIAGP